MATRRTTESVRTPESAQASEKAASRRATAPTIKPAAGSGATTAAIRVSESTRRAMIEQAAYLRAERRGFAPGSEVEDWLAAEAEVDALLRAGTGRAPQ
jgi:hypothetical protein